MSIDTRPGPAAETPDPARPAPRWRRGPGRRRLRRPVAFLLAATFFFGPAAAFVLGERPQEIENRRLSALPSVSDGWSFFPDFATWATDHLPLRKQAVEGNAALSEEVFGEPPSYGGGDGAGVAGVPGTDPGTDRASAAEPAYPPVIQGGDGWLYYGSDVAGVCGPGWSVDETLTRLTRLARAVQASGRRFVFVVAPDKTTMWPQELPETYLGKGCAEARKAEFWTKLRAAPPPGHADLRAVLDADQQVTGVPVYRRTDTHWTQRGALLYAKVLADALQPGLWAGLTVRPTGTVSRPGDLSRLVGRPQTDSFAGFELSRSPSPRARWSYEMPAMPFSVPSRVAAGPRPPGLPLVGEPTLLLGDSFSNSSRSVVPQLFTSLSVLHYEVAAVRPDVTAAAVAKTDVVVWEVVERTLAAGRGSLLEDRALAAIERALADNPR